jgi:hypothetical protein
LTASSVPAISQYSDCKTFKINAVESFIPLEKKGYVPFYIEKGRKALAVNSEEYGDSFAIASYTFSEAKGKYNIKINTIIEDDGEPTYKFYVNKKFIAEVQNEPSDTNFVSNYLDFGTVKLKPRDIISIAFNAHTNGKIPEGESTAYARGRWIDIEIIHICK